MILLIETLILFQDVIVKSLFFFQAICVKLILEGNEEIYLGTESE